MRFTTTIVQNGNNTGIAVPDDVMAELGPQKRHAVVVTIGDYSYRSTATPYQGRNMISLSADNRSKAGVAGGDEVEVELELDTAPREVEVPSDLAEGLSGNAVAAERFAVLSFSNKNRIVLSITDAKTPETRQRRIDKALAELTGP
jgi:antitoxin component of MazEF toxin-antitoxin module